MAAFQNTLIIIDDTTIAANIKPTLVAELREVSKATGMSLGRLLNRAVDQWMDIEAPVYMSQARERRRRQA